MEERINFTLFYKWPKIPRLNRDCIITEKIDGTNSQINIVPKDWAVGEYDTPDMAPKCIDCGDTIIQAGSRKRWLTKEKDNFGFFKWASENRDELIKLGVGRHYGEWWGQGVQRNYGLKERRFSLFNTSVWMEEHPEGGYVDVSPEICSVVPMLYRGPFNTNMVDSMIEGLKEYGSHAVPGFMQPEGVVVFHVAANKAFKVMCENDQLPKGVKDNG